jgi:hypothetical protein
MNNISLNGECIHLKPNVRYIAIDPLYTYDIKLRIRDLTESNFDSTVQKEIFPYTDSPFATLFFSSDGNDEVKINISNIKSASYEDKSSNCFSCDTGLVVFIERAVAIDFINLFDYDLLVESSNEIPINVEYWDGFKKKFNSDSYGLILSLGINSNSEFTGSGFYKIEQ